MMTIHIFVNIKLLYLYCKKRFSCKLYFLKRNDFEFEKYSPRDRVCLAKRKLFTFQCFLKINPVNRTLNKSLHFHSITQPTYER